MFDGINSTTWHTSKAMAYGLSRLPQRLVTKVSLNPGDSLGVSNASMPSDNDARTIKANTA